MHMIATQDTIAKKSKANRAESARSRIVYTSFPDTTDFNE